MVIKCVRRSHRLSACGELMPCPPRTVGPGSIAPGHILRHQHFCPSPTSCLTALQIAVSHPSCSPCAHSSGSNQGWSVPYTPGTRRGQRCRRHSGAGGRWQSDTRSRFVRFVRKIVFCGPVCSLCFTELAGIQVIPRPTYPEVSAASVAAGSDAWVAACDGPKVALFAFVPWCGRGCVNNARSHPYHSNCVVPICPTYLLTIPTIRELICDLRISRYT